MVSKASDDLPDPDRPVSTVSVSRGISTSTFLRLCSRAPRMEMFLSIDRLTFSETRTVAGGFGARNRTACHDPLECAGRPGWRCGFVYLGTRTRNRKGRRRGTPGNRLEHNKNYRREWETSALGV